MEKFRRKVELIVEVEAFTESDADDYLNDCFGVGEYMDEVEVKEMRIVPE